MQLIESYLHEVGRYLPEDQREDILGELRSSLEEEAREFSGSDNPTREHVESVLNKFGHPINVASAYKEPRYLIGPELYPAFVDTISTIFTVSLVAVVSFQLLTWVTSGASTGLWSIAENVVRLSLWLVAVTVISFATLEYYGERVGWYDNWKASSLSDSPPAFFDRGDLMTNVVSEGLFLLWWNDVLVLQNWIPGMVDTTTVTLAQIWAPLLWPVNFIIGVWFVLHCFTLLRREWTRPALFGEIVIGVLALTCCIYLIAQPNLITVSSSIEGLTLLNNSFRVSLVFVAGVIAWDWWQAFKQW